MTEARPTVSTYTIKPLGPDTWEPFARLAEKHNGVWGGCCCTTASRASSSTGTTGAGGSPPWHFRVLWS